MTVNELLKVAAGEIGYHEGNNNDNKYGIAYGLNNQPWCVIFIWWCFRQLGSDLFPNTAHCDGVRSYAKGIGRWFNHAEIGVGIDLKPGDLVVLDYDNDGSGDHICIVESVANNNRFTTVEGNYGDQVCRVNRTLEGVSGLYRPAYDDTPAKAENASDEEIPAQDETITYPVVNYGDTNVYVALLQAKLKILGYNVGLIDGEYGPMTLAAVTSFQVDNGLDPDGIAGPLTFTTLYERGV